MVVVDRLSKYSYSITLKHPFTAKRVVEVFTDRIISKHDIPKSIISDKDKIFISNFWKELFAILGTVLKKKYSLSSPNQRADRESESVFGNIFEMFLQ